MGGAYAIRTASRQMVECRNPEIMMHDAKLVTMLNQIATFYRRRPAEEAAAEIAAHVEKFWEARMRRAAIAHLDAGGEGLEANAAAALAVVRAREAGRVGFDAMVVAKLEAPLEG
jgi:formate dehydrogenase subunit delta